jgi:predicted alpha-1,6-mannanase (GH76 family)
MDVLIDAFARTNDTKYSAYFDKWFDGIKVKNGDTYHNVFYDDMEWNALTFLRLYDVTKDEKYLDAAKELWSDIISGWNDTYAEGGIAWKKDMPYSKNACSNGPAAILAARLYNITKEDSCKQWAQKIYEWEKNTLYEWATGGIYDNINGESGVISKAVLTYNTGTFIGAAVELYNITGDITYLNDAQKCANYTITKCIDTGNNVLRDEGNGDNALFKGIFIRYYYLLMQEPDLNADYKRKFVNFFNNNALSVWTKATYKQSLLFGSSWIAPPAGEAQLTAQASACMMIEAKAAFEKAGKQ